ncbi:hypothetical protein [Microbacterium sp. Marseille-Q6965]|uniref:hypothetical protein n=1 Tax=Microbacterium sp. Marseille-Q6965 TaxID=2965072 RepID=UPI0021B81B70|nr:hypothetical protein [Microbacterium sp. Marseille-Q6965]
MPPLLARIAGAVVRGLFRVLLLVRHPRPIHTRGHMLRGELVWLGNPRRSGVHWIDSPSGASVPVVARLSRSVGLPPALPDVPGLALRMDAGGRPADVQLASAGFGVPGRFLLAPTRSVSRARFTTVVPYRTPSGPLLLGARTIAAPPLPAGGAALRRALTGTPWRLRLYFAHPRGLWHPFADLTLQPAPTAEDVHFDSFRHPIPGAGTYAWLRALREPSYHLVQGSPDADERRLLDALERRVDA